MLKFLTRGLLLTMCCLSASAQRMGTGAYAFATFDNRGFDSVNVGNLNVRFQIPIVSRTGRGIPFTYLLQYEGLVWTPVTSSGTTAWVNDPSWGFTGSLSGSAFTGYLSYLQLSQSCTIGGKAVRSPGSNMNYVYHDSFGAQHLFNYKVVFPCPGSGSITITGDGSTNDGSGYTLVNGQIKTRDGKTITPATSSNSQSATNITDANGNEITSNGAGAFTDTLGVKALTISGSGPVTFTYPVTLQSGGATTASASLAYKTYTVRTNFQCGGITEYGSNSVDLVDTVTQADGTKYQFTYEGTPGATDGAVTGRLASVTLPTEGTISYAYSGGGCNESSGVNKDGTVGTLARTTTDGVRTYTRGTVSSTETTTSVQDEKNNISLYTMTVAGDSSQFFYETHRRVYQGTNTSGGNLLDQYTCYDGASAPCDGQAITLPISEADVTLSYNNGNQSLRKTAYDPTGTLPTSIAQYQGTTLLEMVTNTYNSFGEVLSSSTTDGSGNPVSSSTYGYDETAVTATSGIPQHLAYSCPCGNPTSTHVSTGSTTITTTQTNYDTGVPVSAVAADGGLTQYTYDSTQGFVTKTTFPVPSSGVTLSTSSSYDAGSSMPLSVTGMNSGQTTTITTYDPLLRPLAVTLPNGGSSSFSYSSNQSGATQTLNSTVSANTQTLYDGYGRVSRVAVLNGQPTNPWYQTDSCYDAGGLLLFQSVSYQGTGWGTPKQCSGAGVTYSYDALGRVTNTQTSDGTATTTYYNRAVETTDVNGVQRITQYDLLNRIIGVCEISSNHVGGLSPGNCGMDIAGTGYVTSYAYDLANHKTTITQGTQQRIFQTDAAGRTISVTEPERGLTTYSYAYNSTGLQVVRSRPKANQTISTVATQTTTQYDKMSRVVSISYNDTVTPNKLFSYDAVPAGSNWTNASAMPAGRLVVATAGSTSIEYSYDVDGNPTALWQCAPSTCGNSLQNSRPMQFAYDLVGNLVNETDPTSGSITYGRSAAGEITSVNGSYSSQGNPPTSTVVSNVVNTPFGPSGYSLGNGVQSVQTFDTMGRNAGNWACIGSSSAGCSGGTQLYGNTLAYKGLRVVSTCDTVLNQCQSNSYDEFNRIIGITDQSHLAGDIGSYTYSYDIYGNRLSQTALSGGVSTVYSFNAQTNHNTGMTYDAAGNEMNDGMHTYTYDAEGNVLTVDNGPTATYVYDALNHRVRVQTASATNEYLFDPFGRRTSTWQTSNDFGIEGRIYMDGKQIAYRGGTGGTYFEHQNWLGTDRLRTNYVGQVAATESSLSYGDNLQQNVLIAYGDQDNNQFAGQDYDAESSTSHAQFRQYSSTQGRWMSPDPYDGSYDATNPQSLNRYSYGVNNPFGFIDPLGLSDCIQDDCPAPPPPPPPDPGVPWDPCGIFGCDNPGSGNHPSGGGGGNAPSKPTPSILLNDHRTLSECKAAGSAAAADSYANMVPNKSWLGTTATTGAIRGFAQKTFTFGKFFEGAAYSVAGRIAYNGVVGLTQQITTATGCAISTGTTSLFDSLTGGN